MSRADLIPYTPETSRLARGRTRVCAWCGRFASKGKQWCERHAPGYAGDRRKGDRRNDPASAVRIKTIRDELTAELLLPAVFQAWPPIARIVAVRPRHVRQVLIADVTRAWFARSVGDPAPWAEIVANMRAHGIMRDSDTDISQWRA